MFSLPSASTHLKEAPNAKKVKVSVQIDYNDPRYAQAAAEILRRHDNGEPEANITAQSVIFSSSRVWSVATR